MENLLNYVFDPSMSEKDIQKICDDVYQVQESNEFGHERYVLLFKPGKYDVTIKVGFYTSVAGLGQDPSDVIITGGIDVNGQRAGGNVTTNFWRSVENLTIAPSDGGLTRWAVSQAAPMRRLHIKGDLHLFDYTPQGKYGWASGGFISDSIINGKVVPGSQQQFFSRNNDYQAWEATSWNTVLVGDMLPHVPSFPDPSYTIVEETPVIREKPYLWVDSSGDYHVFVPNLGKNRRGVSWKEGHTPGDSKSIDDFHIVDPNQTSADAINHAIKRGMNVLFLPGIYRLEEPLKVEKENTIILGLGFATLMPVKGNVAMEVADVDGVIIAGLLFDAGPINSPGLLKIGTEKSSNKRNHSANPTLLSDLFFRIGGGEEVGNADVSLVIHSNHVIGDHFWIWRADHGKHIGWEINTAEQGLVVTGNDVTLYGLFIEHFQGYQTLWSGNGGRTYFYQSEIPYDIPTQEIWKSHHQTVNGYASYKVADNVTSHEAWGLGIYCYFRDAPIQLQRAIEVPQTDGVAMHHMTTIWLNGTVGSEITHVINDKGNRVYDHTEHDKRATVE